MQETEINKLAITVLNVIIIGSLPLWFMWHIRKMKQCEHMTYDYWIQFIIALMYFTAFSAEIPALWARWKAYYIYKMEITADLYVLTTWDRFNHLALYLIIMFLTWSITYKRVPKAFTDTFV